MRIHWGYFQGGWGTGRSRGAGDQGEGHSTLAIVTPGVSEVGPFEILPHLLHAWLHQGKGRMGLVIWQVQACVSEQGMSPVALSWGLLMRAVPSKPLKN